MAHLAAVESEVMEALARGNFAAQLKRQEEHCDEGMQ
jgi:hypothetical protein